MRLVSVRDAFQTEFGFTNFPQNTPISYSDMEKHNKPMFKPDDASQKADKQFELWSWRAFKMDKQSYFRLGISFSCFFSRFPTIASG